MRDGWLADWVGGREGGRDGKRELGSCSACTHVCGASLQKQQAIKLSEWYVGQGGRHQGHHWGAVPHPGAPVLLAIKKPEQQGADAPSSLRCQL